MKKFVCFLLAVCMLLCVVAGCTADEPQPTEEVTTIKVGALTGPTAMGMVKLMDDSDKGTSANKYEFELKSEASAFVAALAKGEIDIAAVPANLASVIYNNTDGGVKLLAINTLGVLYIVERGDSVKSLADLSARPCTPQARAQHPSMRSDTYSRKTALTARMHPKSSGAPIPPRLCPTSPRTKTPSQCCRSRSSPQHRQRSTVCVSH